MKAWLLPKLGSIDALTPGELPDPVPAAGEVVLKLKYAALNPADRYLAEGAYPAKPPFPHVLGRDGVGEVIAVGGGVSDVKVGDVRAIVRGETGVSRHGTFAERVALGADSLIPVPEGWSLEQSAGATLVYLTAFQAIRQWRDLPLTNCTTLVTGASGGVGVASIQLAKAMGHFVVALSRGTSKTEQLRQLGADLVLDPTSPTWRKLLGDRKVNLAIDNVGGEGFNDVIGVLDMNGRVSVVGRLAGPVPQFNTASLFFRRLQIGGVAVGTYSRSQAVAAWDEVLTLMKTRGATPLVDRVFAFDELPQAFARLKEGPMGKVLIRVS